MRHPALLWLLFMPLLALAGEPEVKVRSRLQPAETVLVGGTLNLQVDLLVDTWFTAAPQFPTLIMDGALVSEPRSEAPHLNERIEGKPFFGVRFVYRITPQEARRFDVPALAIQVRAGQGSGLQTVHAPVSSFVARQPVGSGPEDGARLVARRVTLSQEVRHSHEPLRIGDSITRRLRIQAEGTQTMLIPAPAFAEVKGLRRYVHTPSLAPLSDGRGSVRGGEREDAVTYVVAETGRFRLPPVYLRWWDAASGEAHDLSMAALEIKVAGSAGYRSPFSINDDLRTLGHKVQVHVAGHWLPVFLSLLVLGGAGYFGRSWIASGVGALRNWHRTRERVRLNSSGYAWRRIAGELSAVPPQLSALYLWIHRTSGCREMSAYARTLPAALAEPLLAFQKNRYGREQSESSATDLMKILPGLRRAIAGGRSASARHGLKELNP
ncbi:hypothetical protein [Pseudomonas aeruginosa]|uniref:hypothetical protein n=1 Tax=Pseudomonas aeruginosa TaxID=287 RepID=UPI003D063778